MLSRLEPKVGQWYQDEQGNAFEVVAFDADEGVVEIQHFDGAVEELEIDSWYGQILKPHAEPEDWSGPFDDLVRDDFGDIEESRHFDDWANPLDKLDWEE